MREAGDARPMRPLWLVTKLHQLAICVTPLSPSTIVRAVQQWSERLGFAREKPISCDPAGLTRKVTEADVDAIFSSDAIGSEWPAIEQQIAQMDITDEADSVNPGDRRAIYYVVRHFRPRTVLEVGTHLGGSTMHIVAGLRKTHEDDAQATYHLTTVDVKDVNDRSTTPWLDYGSRYSPAEMAVRLGLERQISFVTRGSLEYLASCEERYDFIFLDGDHAPGTVYHEVPAALRVLESGGVILLHDYFPALQPLWSDGKVIQGPWLAVERLRSEGAKLKALPLGELPWPTKLGSQKTSLALLVGG